MGSPVCFTTENSLLWVWAFLHLYLICFPLYNLALAKSLLLAQQFLGRRPNATWKVFVPSATLLLIYTLISALPSMPRYGGSPSLTPCLNWFLTILFSLDLYLACLPVSHVSRSTHKPEFFAGVSPGLSAWCGIDSLMPKAASRPRLFPLARACPPRKLLANTP